MPGKITTKSAPREGAFERPEHARGEACGVVLRPKPGEEVSSPCLAAGTKITKPRLETRRRSLKGENYNSSVRKLKRVKSRCPDHHTNLCGMLKDIP